MNQHQPENNKSLWASLSEEIKKTPEWLDVEHPDFPKYFSIAVYDENGNVVRWWERLPEHMRLPPPL
ncbi:MAG: hypothetical protein QNJ36_11530 [Calothrix sp. MO_167.B42]|nr:hypothetical protein [Calothrix sp. MO_167.B42]